MPALKDVLTKGLPEGYVPVENAPASTPPTDNPQEASSSARCPLPPTNADADSIRTFQKGSSTPQFRVMPLVPQSGGTTTVTTGGSTSGSGGGSGSSGSGGGTPTPTPTPAPTSQTISVTANVAPLGAVITQVTASRSFQLFSISANAGCCVRLYGNAAAQSVDNARAIDAPVPAELTQNIIIDVVFDTTPYFWTTQNIVGVNSDSPQGKTLYVTILNPTDTPLSNATVFITFLPLES
jgi:hypothetical protein